MNDTPGWASPGSPSSGGQEPGPAEPEDRAVPRNRPGAAPENQPEQRETQEPQDQPPQDRQEKQQEPRREDTPGAPAQDAAPAAPAQDSAPPQDAAPGARDSGDPGPQWSKEQPPPAQWSAPSGPGQTPPPAAPGWGAPPPPAGPAQGGPGGYGGYGGYGGGHPGGGHGGHPGWGAGWGGPPPAAKPGVIPLRPLGIGELLDGAVATMRTYWRTVLGISLAVAVITEVVVVLLQGFVLGDLETMAPDNSASTEEVARALGEALVATGVVFLVSIVGTVLATAMLTAVTSRAVLGRPVTTGEAWRDARPQLPRLFGLVFLLPLIAFAVTAAGALPGVVLALAGSEEAGIALAVLGGLAGGLVALWLMIRFSLASPALMLEKQSIRKALARSAKLVRGSWWRVFGIQLLATVIANVVASIVIIPFTFIAAAADGGGPSSLLETTGDVGWTYLVITGIGSVIGSTITFPIAAGVTVLLYVDQRIRREALDLELARAAGLHSPASDGGPGSGAGS